MKTRIPAEQRFWPKVDKGDGTGCWLWTAYACNGYGMFKAMPGRGPVLAHRYAYELLVGPIPEGLQLDHLCRVTRCVKAVADEYGPAHLDAITSKENTRRGESGRRELSKTHCPKGHPYDEANTYRWIRKSGSPNRVCRTCKLAYSTRRKRVIDPLLDPEGPLALLLAVVIVGVAS